MQGRKIKPSRHNFKRRKPNCDSLLLRFRNRNWLRSGFGSARSVIKLRFRFRCGKKLRFLRFRFRNTAFALCKLLARLPVSTGYRYSVSGSLLKRKYIMEVGIIHFVLCILGSSVVSSPRTRSKVTCGFFKQHILSIFTRQLGLIWF